MTRNATIDPAITQLRAERAAAAAEHLAGLGDAVLHRMALPADGGRAYDYAATRPLTDGLSVRVELFNAWDGTSRGYQSFIHTNMAAGEVELFLGRHGFLLPAE